MGAPVFTGLRHVGLCTLHTLRILFFSGLFIQYGATCVSTSSSSVPRGGSYRRKPATRACCSISCVVSSAWLTRAALGIVQPTHIAQSWPQDELRFCLLVAPLPCAGCIGGGRGLGVRKARTSSGKSFLQAQTGRKRFSSFFYQDMRDDSTGPQGCACDRRAQMSRGMHFLVR